MAINIDSKIPEGPVAEKWSNYKAHQRLVNPKNKLKLDVIVVGTGLAGASAAASLGEMGFNVLNFCIQDSPRRAHSIAAQGGIPSIFSATTVFSTENITPKPSRSTSSATPFFPATANAPPRTSR